MGGEVGEDRANSFYQRTGDHLSLIHILGRENIFDFSIGNPNVPAPQAVTDEIVRLAQTEDAAMLHGYTSAQGDAGVRERIAEAINQAHGTSSVSYTHLEYGGSGIGLSIVRVVMEAHNCAYGVRNETDGVTFFCEFDCK